MKNIHVIIGLAAGIVFLGSCDIGRNVEPMVMTVYKPVMITRESLNRSIEFKPSVQIGSPAKIYFKDNYIYISERNVGVHIIDNSDKRKPINKGYIYVPGCVDMAIKGNTLYVDNVTDLIAIDIAEIGSSKIKVTKRIPDKFSEPAPPDNGMLPAKYLKENRPANSIIISWKK